MQTSTLSKGYRDMVYYIKTIGEIELLKNGHTGSSIGEIEPYVSKGLKKTKFYRRDRTVLSLR